MMFTHIVLSTHNPLNEDAVFGGADRKDEEARGSISIHGPRTAEELGQKLEDHEHRSINVIYFL